MVAAYSGRGYSGQPVKVAIYFGPEWNFYIVNYAGYSGQPDIVAILAGPEVSTISGDHCTWKFNFEVW